MAAIPLIEPEARAGGLPGAATLDPGGYAALSTSGLRALAAAGSTIASEAQHTYQTYAAAQKEIRNQQVQLETEQALGVFDRAAADAVFSVRADPTVTPDQYAAEVEKRVRAAQSGIEKNIKTPEVLPRFQIGAQRHLNTQLTKAKYEGLEQQLALNTAAVGLLNDRDQNTAVFGATPEDRQAATERITERTDRQLRTRGFTPEQYKAEMKRNFSAIEEGEIRRDIRDPAKRVQVMDRLLTGGYTTLPPDKQLQLAKQLSDQDTADRRQAEADARRDWTETKKTALSDLHDRGLKKTLTEADYDAAVKQWQLSPEEQNSLRAAMKAPKEDEAPSDRATLDYFTARVHTTGPVLTTERELNAARDAGKLNYKDWKSLLDTRDSRIKWHLEQGRSENGRRHQQAEENLRANLGIPSIWEKLDEASKKAWGLAVQELERRSTAFRGTEDPLKVADDMIPRYRQMLAESARVNEGNIRTILKYPSVQDLTAAEAAGRITRSDADAQRRLFLELEEMQRRQRQEEAWKQTQRDVSRALGNEPPRTPVTRPGVRSAPSTTGGTSTAPKPD